MSRSDLTDVTVVLHHETQAAWLVSDDGERDHAVWVPKSQSELERDGDSNVWVLTLPDWLAEEKGLI